MRPRRYFQYIDKDSSRVSLKWKVLHLLIFFLTAINSFISAYAFGELFGMFNYQCILCAKPTFDLKHISYKATDATNTTQTHQLEVTEIPFSTTAKGSNMENVENSTDGSREESSRAVTIRNSEFWFANDTLTGRVEISKTIFSTLSECNFVLFVPLLSMIVAIVFSALVVICGRGGKGNPGDLMPRQWLYVYPVLIASGILVILSIISRSKITKGMEEYCARFEEFTQNSKCNYQIKYFMEKERPEQRDFYYYYVICKYTFSIEIVLWITQIVLTVFRIVFAADFQFNSILIKNGQQDDFESEEEAEIHRTLLNTYPMLKPDTSLPSKQQLLTTQDENNTTNV